MRWRSPSWAWTMRRLIVRATRRPSARARRRSTRRRLEVAPQQVQLAGDDVEPLQPSLERGELPATLLVLGAERIGPDRAERATAAVEPRAELHPLLEVAAVLLPELLGQVVHATRVAAEALRGLRADAVEALRARARRGIVRHGLPLSTGSGLVPDQATILSARCACGQQYFGHRKYYPSLRLS